MDHFISLEQAIEMTTVYRLNRDKVIAKEYQDKNILPNAETFDRTPFDEVLARTGCVSLRIYYGMDADLKMHAIIVGVDEEGQDLLPDAVTASLSLESTGSTSTGSGIIEAGQRCPPACSTSLLNP